VYCQLRLILPWRTKKRLPVRLRQPLVVLPQPNAVWAVDFMSDTLYGGRRFRTLNVLDEGVRDRKSLRSVKRKGVPVAGWDKAQDTKEIAISARAD
jgi:hypothetical protein